MLALKHLSIPELIGAAGGDPWKLDDTIQAGSPGEINELATSFRQAGLCITETDEEFQQAKKRFEESWDRDDPAHPINDAEEVRRATQWLKLSTRQMAKVAADLENIAATLAEAQRSGHVSIANLEGRLQRIDDTIDAELQAAKAAGQQLDWSELKRAAVDAVKQSLNEMTALRDALGAKLHEAELGMAADGYDTDALKGAEGDGQASEQDQARADAKSYDERQRAADEALVNSGGPMTPEKAAAAARLRDFATVNDPNANPYDVQYAGERLHDYNMSKFVGPLPVDPVLGTDARQQAKTRLEYQQKLEAGLLGSAPMSPNAATAFLDSCDTQARAMVLNRAEQQLRSMGFSDDGIKKMLTGLGSLSDSIGTGTERYGDAAEETGSHALGEFGHLSAADAEVLTKWGGRLGAIGNIAQLVSAGIDFADGGDTKYQDLGSALGGLGGSWAGGAAAGAAHGSVGGPFTAAAAAVIGGVLGGLAGSEVGGAVGTNFDPHLPVGTGGGGGSW